MRTILLFFICGTVLGLSSGCAHMVESRVVQAFAQSLQAHDSAKLIAGTSSDFESKAVKGDETFRALKMIELPEGMPKVTFVKSIMDEDGKKVIAKRVTTTVGKDKRKLYFTLKPDGSSGRWVVDDLFLSKDDLESNKSVAARLAVLLALQESLDAWKSGLREQILAAATPEFAQSLSDLTTLQLAQFAKKVTADMADTTKVVSNEYIGDETAEMLVLKGDADLILRFRREGHSWRLDDLAVRYRREGDDIASARLVSAAMGAALKFESAFRRCDKRVLEQVCTPSFFEGSLAPSDLTQVHLPETGPGLDDFDMKLDNARATFCVRAGNGNEELTISLKQQDIERLHAIPRYLVDDVTIYDLKSSQDKRLSSLFTAQAAMECFSAALARRDVETLKKNSTHDFNQRVWAMTTAAHFDGLPMARLAPVKPTILQTRFKGSLTEILIEQGETPMTYVLRDEGGRMLVDDVLTPATDWPESMKASVEVLISILNFRAALAASNMEAIRGTASNDFTRFAWNHFQMAPQFDLNPDDFLKSPLTSISRSEDRADVIFGDARRGARFLMVKEKDQFLVDDVTLIAGPLDRDQIPMKRTIRTQLGQVE